MQYLFYNSSFNQDISGWETGEVTEMGEMFQYNYVFDKPINTNGDKWDVSKVKNMAYMFEHSNTFNQDIGGWNVGEVTDMTDMFENAFAFNKDISSWDVSKVRNMNSMFVAAHAFNQDISRWNVGSVTDMRNMFENADIFTCGPNNKAPTNTDPTNPIRNWKVASDCLVGNMFKGSGFNDYSAKATLTDVSVEGVFTVNHFYRTIQSAITDGTPSYTKLAEKPYYEKKQTENTVYVTRWEYNYNFFWAAEGGHKIGEDAEVNRQNKSSFPDNTYI